MFPLTSTFQSEAAAREWAMQGVAVDMITVLMGGVVLFALYLVVKAHKEKNGI